jgi:hypothetical protein
LKILTSEIGRKELESFEIWCWRKMEKISLTDRVRNEETLQRIKENKCPKYNKRRKAKGHMLLGSRLLEHVIEGKIEVTGRRGQLLDDRKKERTYFKWKSEELDRT